MTDDAASEHTAPPESGWSSIRVLWGHAAVLAVVLLAGLAYASNGRIAHPDESVYSAQAKALADGSWWTERPAPDVDRDGTAGPLIDSTIRTTEMIAYARHPAYPTLLLPAYRLLGVVGMVGVSIVGSWCAALVGAFLARRIDGRLGPPTLWLIGVGSPLLFDSYVVIAHSIAAALAGVTFLGVTRAVDDGRARPLLYALPAAAATVAFRTEGVVFVLSLAVTTVAMSFPPIGRSPRRPALWAGVTLAGVGVAAYLVDGRIGRLIGGSGGYGADPSALVLAERTGPLGAIWSSLLRPFHGTWVNANPMVVVTVALLLAAALAMRFLPTRSLFPIAGAVGAAAAAVAAIFRQPGLFPVLINGLVPAFPLLLMAVVLVRGHDLTPLLRRALVTCGVATGLLVVSIYDEGGATEWGGRFFHVLLVPLAVVIVAVLDRAVRTLTVVERRVFVSALVVVSLALGTMSVRWLHTQRNYHDVIIDGTAQYAERQFGDDRPLVILAALNYDATSRIFWDELDELDVLVSVGPPQLDTLLHNADAAGRDKVVLLTTVNREIFVELNRPALDDIGWAVTDSYIPPAGYPQLLTVGPVD